jgi:hypothetical protein
MEHRVDLKLGEQFFKYDRLTLAEAVMETQGDRFRLSTYLEFRRRYEDANSGEREWLRPAREAVQTLTEKRIGKLMTELRRIAERVADDAGIPSSLPRVRKPNKAVPERIGATPTRSS